MTERTLNLPESLYDRLVEEAQTQGMTPVNWIASKLTTANTEQQTVAALASDIIGSVNSKANPKNSRLIEEGDLFGKAIVAKLAKQGIHLP